MAPSDSVTRTIHRTGIAPPLPVRVRVVGMRDKSCRFAQGTITVGGASTCDLIIEDPSVSRRHVELELVPEGVLVRDLKSRNGTFYLDQRVERMVLAPGTSLRLGSTTIAIELDAELADEPLALAGFRGLVGASPAMQRLFGMVARLDGSLVPVMVHGETGVGKELVARAVHEGSRVAGGPFVPVNCGASPRELVASTLFGHKKGAFTGATDARKGAFGAASGGTLLLDEIGELPLDVQPALLRVLETRTIVRVGSERPIAVDVRIVAATHRDLDGMVTRGEFRQDLLFRLEGAAVQIPPLRARVSEIEALARVFLDEANRANLPDVHSPNRGPSGRDRQ